MFCYIVDFESQFDYNMCIIQPSSEFDQQRECVLTDVVLSTSVSDFYNISFFDDKLVNFSILSDGNVQADHEDEIAKVRRGQVLLHSTFI